MDAIRNTAASLCATLVITGIFSMLLPEGGWNRCARFAVRLFLLLSIALPFASGDFSLDLEGGSRTLRESAAGEMEALAEEQLLRNFATNLELAGEQALAEAGISVREIVVAVHIADEQRIDITSIRVALEPGMEALAGEAKSIITGLLGRTPEITAAEIQGGTGDG